MSKHRTPKTTLRVDRQELKICKRIISQWGKPSYRYTLNSRQTDQSALKKIKYPEQYVERREKKTSSNKVLRKKSWKRKKMRRGNNVSSRQRYKRFLNWN